MFVPRYLCILLWCTVRGVYRSWPYSLSNSLMISSTMLESTCETLRSSMFQRIVHCLPSMILLNTHLLYGFSLNFYLFMRLLERLSQNNSSAFSVPCTAFFRHTYDTLFPLSMTTFFHDELDIPWWAVLTFFSIYLCLRCCSCQREGNPPLYRP